MELAEAAFDAHRTQFGISALDSYVNASVVQSPVNNQTSPKLGAVQEKAAEALLQQNNFTQAISLFEQALLHIKDQSERDRIGKLQADAQMRNRLMIANGSRQPVVSEQITQSAIVRPN